jgi:2-oxo-4-hydroxy-4-carboxy-5-ureidoimidazoline decarboxylase
MTIEELNALPAEEAWRVLERCCGASVWVDQVCSGRPYDSLSALKEASDAAFEKMHRNDWKEAFEHHPRIGDLESVRRRFASTSAWAGEEQKGAAEADDSMLKAFAEGNEAYEARFGHIFIVCATGKGAKEMLEQLQHRLENDPADEWLVAAEEQTKITRLRLNKLIDG